jgi:hypothetical protein
MKDWTKLPNLDIVHLPYTLTRLGIITGRQLLPGAKWKLYSVQRIPFVLKNNTNRNTSVAGMMLISEGQ